MLNGFVSLIRSNRTSRNAKTILFHIKRFTGTICRRKLILYHLKRLIGTICHRRLIPYHLKRSTGTECQRLTDLFRLKRSTGTKCRTNHILFHLKRFRGTKPEQFVARISQHIRTTIRQSSPIHNHIPDPSYTAMYTHPPDQTTTERLHRHGHRSA